MPTVNPQMLVQSSLKGVTTSPSFATLSPEAQAAIRQASQSSNPTQGLANNPALQAAFSEARQKGLLDADPLWKSLVKAVAITGGVALAGPALGVLTGGAPAVTGATATTTGAPGALAADEVFTAGPVAGAGLSGVDLAGMGAGTAASTGFGAALKAALPTIISSGTSLGGAIIGAHGNTEAAKTQAAAAEKAAQIQADQLDRALAQAKYIWQTQRADQSGYRSSGNNALGALDFGLGLPAPSFDAAPVDPSIANPAPSTGVAPGAVDAKGNPLPGAAQAPSVIPPTDAQQRTNASPLGTGGGGLVPVRSPDGLVKLIPQTQVDSALQAGGTRV